MNKLILPLLLLLSINSFALSGTGSVSFQKTVLPLLDTNQTLKKTVLCNFEINSDPTGIRIGKSSMPNLDGARIGPYTMWATFNNQRIILAINTKIIFFNKNKQPLAGKDLYQSSNYEEKLDSIEIFPADMELLEAPMEELKHENFSTDNICIKSRK